MKLKDFDAVYPMIIECREMNPDITPREAAMFANDLCDTCDELYGEVFVGASGNMQEMKVIAYFSTLVAAKEFRSLWDKGRAKVIREALNRRFFNGDEDVPF